MKRCLSFLDGRLAWEARSMCVVDNRTWSPRVNVSSHRFLFAFCSWLAFAMARVSCAIFWAYVISSRMSWTAGCLSGIGPSLV